MESLCYQFLDIVEAYNSPEQVFDMINNFCSGCSDAVENVPNLRSYASTHFSLFYRFCIYVNLT